MSRNGSLKTDDLALAVTLIMEGYPYELLRKVQEHDGFMRKTCVWVFDKEVQNRVDEYSHGKAMVNPTKFVLTWGVVRREMIDFLGAD